MTHVLVVGDLNIDVVVAHDQPIAPGTDTAAHTTLAGGGSAANTACWLASLGESVRLLAARGDDALGLLAAEQVADAGVGLVGPVVAGTATGTCVVLVDGAGERTMLPDRGANDRLRMEDVVVGLDPLPAWLHVSGYALLHEGSRAAGRAAIEAGLAGGSVVSVDAASEAPIRSVGAEAFLTWIDGVHLVLANDDEVDALGGAAAVLAHAAAVVVKHGSAGATWTDGRRSEGVEGLPVAVVDTTGAGDAFAAGWIAASRAGGAPPAALAEAVRAGAAAVARRGGRP